VGSRSGYKNYTILKAAYEKTPELHQNFKLVCFGGPKPCEGEVPNKGESQYIAGGDELLASYYRRAIVFVYPSLYEGFGLPIVEAMKSGCPIITTRGGSIPEIALEHAIYFDPYSEAELTACLRSAVASSTTKEKQKSAYAHANTFTWGNCWADTLTAYNRVIS
jgi:glycosyltransferase involved in cell wall biosynthesis